MQSFEESKGIYVFFLMWSSLSFNQEASQEVRKYSFQQQQQQKKCGAMKSAAISPSPLVCNYNTKKLLGFCTQRANTVFLLWKCWIWQGSNTGCFSPGGETETVANKFMMLRDTKQGLLRLYAVIHGVSAYRNTKLCTW